MTRHYPDLGRIKITGELKLRRFGGAFDSFRLSNALILCACVSLLDDCEFCFFLVQASQAQMVHSSSTSWKHPLLMEILGVAGICRNTPYTFLHLYIIPFLPHYGQSEQFQFLFRKMPRNKYTHVYVRLTLKKENMDRVWVTLLMNRVIPKSYQMFCQSSTVWMVTPYCSVCILNSSVTNNLAITC